jgi:gamma-glutamylcysteine synthetase
MKIHVTMWFNKVRFRIEVELRLADPGPLERYYSY